jgi:tRNA threonylcarbamoyladenosine biosynthesis protein TsaB
MKLLAIDTATERCSVALCIDDRIVERVTETQRGHADLVLPMVEAVLAEGGLTLRQLDGLAYGRGPGAFTGVRIAVGVAQGLAYGAQLATVGVSDLAAVAQQFASAGARILVCMDARMNEVYWGRFEATPDGLVVPTSAERVDRPEAVEPVDATVFAGTGFAAYPQLIAGREADAVHGTARPYARDIARLAAAELRAGRGQAPEQAQPVYLRDQVATVKAP